MIRQAISCDVCNEEKGQTNHWFVAFEIGGELRVGAWNSRNKLRPGAKHLCGQTCLHRLVDEFMAMAIGNRASATIVDAEAQEAQGEVQPLIPMPLKNAAQRTANFVSSPAAYSNFDEFESSARLVPTPLAAVHPDPIPPAPIPPAAAVLHPTAVTLTLAVDPTLVEPPIYSPRRRRLEAWERERERELRAANRRHTA